MGMNSAPKPNPTMAILIFPWLMMVDFDVSALCARAANVQFGNGRNRAKGRAGCQLKIRSAREGSVGEVRIWGGKVGFSAGKSEDLRKIARNIRANVSGGRWGGRMP